MGDKSVCKNTRSPQRHYKKTKKIIRTITQNMLSC